MNPADTTDTTGTTCTDSAPPCGATMVRAQPADHQSGPATNPEYTRPARFYQVLRLLGQERAPGGDYYPSDDDILRDWAVTRRHCADDRHAAARHLDSFLICHLGTVRDLMVRAACGHAPGRLLDEIEAEVSLALQLPVS